jgi:hypothetical protein
VRQLLAAQQDGALTLMMKLGLVVATLFLCFVLAEETQILAASPSP